MSRAIDEILADPVVRSLDPAGKPFLQAHVLSGRVNPFPIEIAAVVVQGFPNLKSVPAFGMLMDDYRAGVYEGKDTLVLPSSGNTAYAVARLAPAFGFARVIVVVSQDVPPLKRAIVAALPQVDVVVAARDSMGEAVALTRRLGARAHLLDQYGHEANRAAHERHTGPELIRALGGEADIVITALGSAGTAMGVARYLKTRNPRTVVLGAQPHVGQLAPGTRDARRIEVVPFRWRAMLDDVVYGTEIGARTRMRELWSEVEPIPGPSAGLSFDCLLRYLAGLSETERDGLRGKRAAILCHDSGLLYPEFAAVAAAPQQTAQVA